MSCGCGSNSKNCPCDATLTGDIVYDGLAFECLDDLQQELFSIPTGEPFNNVLQTIFAQICTALNQVNDPASAARWFVGAGEPNFASDPKDLGDMFLNNLNGDVYQLTTAPDTWTLDANIKGTAGDDGDNGVSFRYGTGNPLNSLGNNGDTYADLATPDVALWIKSASVWSPTGINLRGDTGANGSDGTNGTNGTNGADGADGLQFIQGIGVPAPSLGENGDSYLDSANGDLYLKGGGVWAVTGNIYTAPIGLAQLFNAGKITEQSLIGINTVLQLTFSDDVSVGRFDYGNTWTTDTWKSPGVLNVVQFKGVFNLKVNGVDGATANDVTVSVKKNGVAFGTFTFDIPAATPNDTIIPLTFETASTAFALNDIVVVELSTPNDPAYGTFVGVAQVEDMFFNVQL